MTTLSQLFLNLSSNPETSGRTVIECCDEHWTYEELHSITSALAAQFFEAYGAKPTVAVISENHPYYIAVMLAVWMLGGSLAPLDFHAPSHLMKAMLHNISPTFAVIPRMDTKNIKLAQDLSIHVHIIGEVESTLSSLVTQMQKIVGKTTPIDLTLATAKPDDIALYLHTSSATSTSNLKFVPLTHAMLISNGSGVRSWFERNLSIEPMYPIRMIGWSPFSHAIGMCVDFVPSILLTGGCYIFAIAPTGYASQENTQPTYDVPKAVLEAILVRDADVFCGVPWILDGIMHAYNAEQDASRRAQISSAFKRMKYYISSGAATSEETTNWAIEHGLPLIISIGMSETTGLMFISFGQDAYKGYCITDGCLQDAVYTLVDEDGAVSHTEGELYISGKYGITKRYYKYESSSFTEDEQGIITFRTGDIYRYGSSPDHIIWKGRKDDFIQLKSGEILDPRPIEQTLNKCSAIELSCVVGNTFLSGSADFTCAILQLTGEALPNKDYAKVQISKVLASINADLSPPLRISWSRVLILLSGQQIPYTKKGMIFRKKLQSLFGDQLEKQLAGLADAEKSKLTPMAITQRHVADVVVDAVSTSLGVKLNEFGDSLELSFAELGMDSAMAIKIVNKLNNALNLKLPPNTCHIYIDVASLTKFLCRELSIDFSENSPKTTAIMKSPPPAHEPIVIVGKAFRLPGDIKDSTSFWEALVNKRTDILTSTPEDRWDHGSFTSDTPGQITFSKSGFVDIATFDNTFFGIPGPEAVFISPQTRLALEASFEALENANIPLSTIKGTDAGVFVAAGLDPHYGDLLFRDRGYEAYSRFYGTGVMPSTICGRLSYLLDIHGPSITVETACSGGMVALDQAVRHLQSGRGESAIVTAVNTHTMPGMFSFLSAQQMTSRNSRSATFTNEADGYATSEGVVSIVVKTLNAAERDGDTILGVIRSTDTRHNGRTQGLVAPSVSAQVALQRSVLRLASLDASDIDFVETHGTGTSLGDLIEIQGINEVFKNSHTPSSPLVLGAAKSCIGHTETASGLVGVVKTLESFARGAVPGLTHLNDSNMNPAIDTTAVPLHIPYSTYNLKPRFSSNIPRRALVVAYGFAGTISASVLEAPKPIPETTNGAPNGSPMLFVVSAKSGQALTSYIKNYISFCRSASESLFPSICYTSCVGREHYRYRFASIAHNLKELIQKLEERLLNTPVGHVVSNPRVLFGFPGQGTHFNGMARDLSNAFSGFRATLTEYSKSASIHTDVPILALLTGTSEKNIDHWSEASQICIYVFQCAVTAWLKSLGIEPCAVMGHSLGEISAAVVAGALEFVDGVRLVIERTGSLKSDPPGAMAAIAAPENVIVGYINSLGLQGRVVIAVSNGEESHVVSGFSDAVELVYHTAKLEGIRCTKLNVHQGFHSPCIKEGLARLGGWLLSNEAMFSPLKVPFYSTATTEIIPAGSILYPEYWVAHARNPVKFWQTVGKFNEDDSADIFLDVGPQPTLWSHMQSLNGSRKVKYAMTGKQGSDQEIEGRRVLPGVAFADLAAKEIEDCEHRIGSIRFHQPLVLEELGSTIYAETQNDGSFVVFYGAAKAQICSGSLIYSPSTQPRTFIEENIPPQRILDKHEVYETFEDQMFFGPAFKNVKQISVWPEFLQAHIHVPETSNTQLDRIRKLDPCLHMFGAVQSFSVPDDIRKDAVYLPTSLQGFILHSETIPSEFYCRYYLPAEMDENYSTSSVRFDVFSLSGELLVSCQKYSVARLPKGAIIQMPSGATLSKRWLQNTWRQEDTLQGLERRSTSKSSDTVVYFSDFNNSAVLSAITAQSKEVYIGELGVSDEIRYQRKHLDELTPMPSNIMLGEALKGRRVSIVLDVSRYHAPGTDIYVALWKHALWIMKFAMSGAIDVSAFVVVSSHSLPTGPAYSLSQPPGIGAAVQGMLRVYRRESGLSPDSVWGVDLPDHLTQEQTYEILSKEVVMHEHGSTLNSTVVAYRQMLGSREDDAKVVRMVPVLLPKAEEKAPSPRAISGLAVIIGMGSIGHALAGYLCKSGCTTVVFMGRRKEDDSEIEQGLQSMRSNHPSVTVGYVQADVTDLESLRISVDTLTSRYGKVQHVLYTAGIIRDATIPTVSSDEFARVLDSKATGAWNMHMISQERKWDLDTFALLSSISVPLGNAGQVAYVAGNAFLDSLAAHRRSVGLPGTSLQLGPWESKVIEQVDLSQANMHVMSHEEGIPLVLRSLAENDPVQVVVSWDVEKLTEIPAYASDPMFRELRLSRANNVRAVEKTYSRDEMADIILSIVKGVLEVRDNDTFDADESLVSCGMDSISFAQMRGNVLQKLGIEVPMRYLSTSISVNRMVSDVCKGRD